MAEVSSGAWSKSTLLVAALRRAPAGQLVQAGRAGEGASAGEAQSRPLSGWLSNGSPCSR